MPPFADGIGVYRGGDLVLVTGTPRDAERLVPWLWGRCAQFPDIPYGPLAWHAEHIGMVFSGDAAARAKD